MFWKWLEPIFKPFREMRAKKLQLQNKVGNVKVDIKKAQSMGRQGQQLAGQAQGAVAGAQGQAAAAQGAVGGAMQQAGGAVPQAPGGIDPNPPIRTSGFLFWKKKVCIQCENELDKTWDSCPFCKKAAEEAAAANKPPAPLKTQAFMISPSGGGASGGMQLLGWIVPLEGSQRGELFTLQPQSSIGTDPACTVCLHDKFMSSKHAEIKAEGGVWVLKDAGSTNGTYVNDKRVDKHELVDNDFIKFGGSLVKFKSL